MALPSALALWFVSYLVGAVPFGYLVARARGVNIFEHGSGNIGATNVARVLGRKLGVFVFLLDFAKGAGPVIVASHLASVSGDHAWTPGMLEVGAGLAAFLGHLFPIYLGFRGGKGVATGAGVVTILFPIPMLAAFLTWVAVAGSTRYVSLASVLAPLALAIVHILTSERLDLAEPRTGFALAAVFLVVVKHRTNLRRLREGTESQIKEHPAMQPVVRSLHVLSLGLWCGASFFFSFIVALSLFHGFENLGELPAADRPAWFPPARAFERRDEALNGPKEQGVRVAGYAVSGIFPWYFLWQGVCAFVALGTAIGWAKLGGWHRRRVWILTAALVLVLIGWPLERHVTALRPVRNAATDAYLQAEGEAAAAARPAMVAARREFLIWHQVSLFTDLATAGLVLVATALAGNLPRQEDGK